MDINARSPAGDEGGRGRLVRRIFAVAGKFVCRARNVFFSAVARGKKLNYKFSFWKWFESGADSLYTREQYNL